MNFFRSLSHLVIFVTKTFSNFSLEFHLFIELLVLSSYLRAIYILIVDSIGLLLDLP